MVIGATQKCAMRVLKSGVTTVEAQESVVLLDFASHKVSMYSQSLSAML